MKRLLLFVLVFLSACGPTQRSRTAATLNDVETYIDAHPDSALAVLRALPPRSLRGPAQRARAALLHSMALDKCYIDLQTDSILAPAVVWYGRHGSPDEKLKTWYYLGRTQYNAGDYREAIVTYTEALDFTGKARDNKYIGLVNQAMADTYSVSYLREASDVYLERAYHAFLAVPDSVMAKLTLYKQALSDVSQRKWKQADSIHMELLEDPKGIEAYLSRVKASYALSLILQSSDNAVTACALFEDALTMSGGLSFANYWAAFAYGLSVIGQESRAESIYNQLGTLYPSDESIAFWQNKTELRRNNYQSAYYLLQKSLEYQDSVLRQTLNQSTIAAQKEYFSFKAVQEKERAQHRKNLLVLTLLVFLLGALLTGLLAHQHRKKEQHEYARLMQLMDVIKRQSEEAENNRTQRFNHLFQNYFNTLGQICADYEEGKIYSENVADKAILRRIDRIVYDFVGNEDGHKAFEDQLDRYLDNIMTCFRKDFPKLKPQDYQLASYVFSGIDMQTTSVLMGADVDVLYTRKSRLKATISKSSATRKTQYMAFFQ